MISSAPNGPSAPLRETSPIASLRGSAVQARPAHKAEVAMVAGSAG